MTDQPTHPIRVAVVDDHPMAREWTRVALEEAEGLKVIGVAEDGVTGLRLIADEMPDVVVLDVHLPDISGVEITRRVRAALPEIGIVIVTGFDDPAYAKALFQLGVRGYLTKSATAGDIVHAVREAAVGRTVILSDAARTIVNPNQRSLAAKERKLLALMASGRRNSEIADAMDISETVVEYRVGQLLQVLGARSRAEGIQLGYEMGIAPPMTTFVDGMPSASPLKMYHGQRSPSTGRFIVQVQEGSNFRVLQHDCKGRRVHDCQSPTGWDHGFSAFGGVELARWLLADCLGEIHLNQTLHYSFKTTFFSRQAATDWMISESEVRNWADDQGLFSMPKEFRELQSPPLR